MIAKINEKIMKILLISFFIIMLFIVLNGVFDYEKVVFKYNAVYLTIGIIVYIYLAKYIYKKIIPKIVDNKKVVYILMGVFTILCVLGGLYFMLKPSWETGAGTWDMGTVFNIAKDYAEKGTTGDIYLYTFPNNIMLTCVYTVLFKIVSLFNITDLLTVATVFNSLLVAGTGILLYYNTKKIFDKSKALMVLIITVLTTPFYLYSACYYSDTFTMFLTMLMLFIFLKLKEKNEFKKTIIWQILLAITFVIALKVKITSIFIFIAVAVYKLLTCQIDIKNIARKTGIAVASIMILYISFNSIIEPLLIPDKQKLDAYQIPIEHWIMMGLNGKGYFSYEEYHYTQSFPTLQERKEADREVIKERLILNWQENTLFKHIKEKLGFAWHDGTYFIPDILRREPVRKGLLHEMVLEEGNNTAIYKYFPQIMHFSMLIFMCINIYRVIKEGKYKDKDTVLFIAIYGLLVFLLIWENRSRYLLTMLPIIMMSQLSGIEYFAKRKDDSK